MRTLESTRYAVMNRCLPLIFVLHSAVVASTAPAMDWIFLPSYFSHDPQTGQRVTQFSPGKPALVEQPADYVVSGYRHTESRIRGRGSADRLHIVEEWGRPVRPYGEWEFPYRPFSVPYHLWGPQFVPWGPGGWFGGGAFGPGGYGYGYGYGHGEPGHGGQPGLPPENGPGGDRPPDGGRHDPPRPLPGDDGYPGRFFGRPTTDHEFFWPRPRDPGRGGAPPKPPPESPPDSG
jgi:hypothetical protein